MKNSFSGLSSREKKSVNLPIDLSREIVQIETKRKNEIKKKNIRDLWENIKQPNLYIIGISEGGENGQKTYLKR